MQFKRSSILILHVSHNICKSSAILFKDYILVYYIENFYVQKFYFISNKIICINANKPHKCFFYGRYYYRSLAIKSVIKRKIVYLLSIR